MTRQNSRPLLTATIISTFLASFSPAFGQSNAEKTPISGAPDPTHTEEYMHLNADVPDIDKIVKKKQTEQPELQTQNQPQPKASGYIAPPESIPSNDENTQRNFDPDASQFSIRTNHSVSRGYNPTQTETEKSLTPNYTDWKQMTFSYSDDPSLEKSISDLWKLTDEKPLPDGAPNALLYSHIIGNNETIDVIIGYTNGCMPQPGNKIYQCPVYIFQHGPGHKQNQNVPFMKVKDRGCFIYTGQSLYNSDNDPRFNSNYVRFDRNNDQLEIRTMENAKRDDSCDINYKIKYRPNSVLDDNMSTTTTFGSP